MAALPTNAYAACTPNASTTIDRCGSVTQCDAIAMEIDEIDSVYLSSSKYRIMGSLFEYEFEIAACQVQQKGLAGFLRANKKTKEITPQKVVTGLWMIEPFFLAKRVGLINNEYWSFTGGTLALVNGTPDPAGTYWQITATSPNNIPSATGWFNVDERMYLNGISGGGSHLLTQYIVTIATVASPTTMTLTLQPLNAGSYMPAANVANPIIGYLIRGTANKSDYEKFCAETPGLNTNNLSPYWIETTRMAMCRSELYDNYRRLLLDNNPEYAMFGDIPDVELNRQQGKDYEDRFLNDVLWGKPWNANQRLDLYRSLPEIDVPAGLVVTEGMEIGRCVGRRASVVGFLEQHAACSRWVDLQGAQLNLPNLFESLRLMQRVREANGSKASGEFDIFTDQKTAYAFRIAMIAYLKAQSQNMAHMEIQINATPTKVAPMGFQYVSWDLFYPAVRINIIWDEAFDDQLTEATAAGVENAGRWLYILDWTKNYVATLGSNKVVNETGNLKTLAAIDSTYACVMKVPTKTTTMYSHTRAVVCECPAGDIIISNFSSQVPEAVTPTGSGSYG